MVFGLGKKEKKELPNVETFGTLSEIRSEIEKSSGELERIKPEVEKVSEKPIELPDIESRIEKTSELETKIEKVMTKETPKVSKPKKSNLKIKSWGYNKKLEEKTDITDMLALEDLSQKIENESLKISKKIKSLSKKSEEFTIDSPEIIELIKLYERVSKKSREFIDKMNEIETDGWQVDETIAAFYKFRIAKALSFMRKEESDIENLCEKIGFTPSKIHEILEKPTEKLIDEFLGEKPSQEETAI